MSLTLPRANIAFLPTPIQPMKNLANSLGFDELWIKRDDLTGLTFGGNKSRKLEYIIGDALEKGADTVITVGGVQSNHCRQTAAFAAAAGLKKLAQPNSWKARFGYWPMLHDRLVD